MIRVCSVALALLTTVPLHAQDVKVPRTRTFPGVASPAFPYAQPEEVGLSTAKLKRLADEVAHWVAGGEVVGAELLIVKDRRIVLHEAFGWADQEEGRPMERNSLFSIKSMSKPFTATAILMLEKDGKLSFTDPASRYIPTLADNGATIHHLLTHTSGFEDHYKTEDETKDGFRFNSLKEWVDDWASEVPTRPLGEYGYADFNYGALGYVVEAVSGVPVETFTEEQILRPLGLDETYTAFSPDAPWADRMNSRYVWDEAAATYKRSWSNEDNQTWGRFYAAAWGLHSTAMDYAKFLAMWMDKGRYGGTRLIPEKSVVEALRTDTDAGYAYGWYTQKTPRGEEIPAFGHGGFDGTRVWAFPAVDAMVIWLTHSRGRAGYGGSLINRIGMLEIFDHPGPYEFEERLVWAGDVEEVEVSQIEQAQYVGIYRIPKGEVVRIWQEGGRLHYRMGEPGERADRWLHLVPIGEHRFTPGRYRGDRLEAIHSRVSFRFVVEDGRVTGFESVVAGQVQWTAHFLGVGEVAAEAIERITEARFSAAKSIRLARAGQISEALHAIQNAQERDALTITASDWHRLCWNASLWGHSAKVMAVCEQSVARAPNNGNARDSRGLARALTGDVGGAIDDLEEFVAWTDNDLARAQRQDWLDALRAGKNPFTPELLKRLRQNAILSNSTEISGYSYAPMLDTE